MGKSRRAAPDGLVLHDPAGLQRRQLSGRVESLQNRAPQCGARPHPHARFGLLFHDDRGVLLPHGRLGAGDGVLHRGAERIPAVPRLDAQCEVRAGDQAVRGPAADAMGYQHAPNPTGSIPPPQRVPAIAARRRPVVRRDRPGAASVRVQGLRRGDRPLHGPGDPPARSCSARCPSTMP